MRVLIVGGTGLISTAITELLCERGDDVTIFNRGETEAAVPDGVTVRHGDRTEYDRFERAMAEAGPFDAVVDMVCYAPAEARSAVRAFDGRCDQYVLCSTVDVYRSPPASYPITESAPRMRSGEGYAPDEARCERVLEDAHDEQSFPVTIVRPWYTYGEGRGILTTLGFGTEYVDRIRRGKPVVTHGDGTSIWGACHRDDVARAFANAVGNEATIGEDYHVTCEEPTTWNAYHRAVADAVDAPAPDLVHVPTDSLLAALPDETETLRRVLRYSLWYDNSEARRDLDFAYTVEWREGVRRVVDWLDKHDAVAESEPGSLRDRVVDAWRDAEREFVRAFQD
jgi:nucleoside-diphosphate-sugar epimerase